MTRLKELAVGAEERLKMVVDLLFDEAMLRPNSFILYATICDEVLIWCFHLSLITFFYTNSQILSLTV